MAEISREEAIHYLENTKEEKICKDCNYVPCSAREECEKQLSYLDKAISCMEKLEKIEHIVFDIGECNELTETIEEKIEKICNEYNHNCDSCMVSRIKQIVKEV